MRGASVHGRSIAYTYDTLNRLITKTPPSGVVVTYTYDLAGRMTGVGDTSSAITAAVPPGGASSVAYTMAFTYDALNRPTATTYGDVATAAAPATTLNATFTHTYNAVNQRTGQTVTDASALGWIDYPPNAASTTSYTANTLNQYTSVITSAGTVTPTYDGNGNLTSDGTYTIGYDAENRLTSASKAGMSASYAYDGRGRRKLKTVNGTTTITITDADNREVLEYDGGTGAVLRWYAYGLGANDVVGQMNVPAGTRTTPVPDILGSVIASMDAGTGVLTAFAYRPYGSSSSAATPFAFTGQRLDAETGFYYYRARHYSAALGRFLQIDPPGYLSSINLYEYVGNDPLNFNDPTGMWSPEAHDKILSYAFQNRLPAAEVKLLQQASRAFDSDTATKGEWAFAHSMRAPGQSASDAMAERDKFIQDQLGIARATAQFGNRERALQIFSEAAHTIMDSSSPLHVDRDSGQPRESNWKTFEYWWHSPNKFWGGETSYSLTPDILNQQRSILNDAYNKVFK